MCYSLRERSAEGKPASEHEIPPSPARLFTPPRLAGAIAAVLVVLVVVAALFFPSSISAVPSVKAQVSTQPVVHAATMSVHDEVPSSAQRTERTAGGLASPCGHDL